MKTSFVISSAALFLGGVLLLIFSSVFSRAVLFLGVLFALMGGIPLVLCWFWDLFVFLSDEKRRERAENPNKEEKEE